MDANVFVTLLLSFISIVFLCIALAKIESNRKYIEENSNNIFRITELLKAMNKRINKWEADE